MEKFNTGKRPLAGLLLMTLVAQPMQTNAGAYVFSGDANGIDIVTHPTGYSGAGGTVSVNVCIVPGTPDTGLMEISVENAVNTWNKLVPAQPNLYLGADNDLGASEVDFESTVLHEIGHCIGNAHPNAATESGLPTIDRNYTKATNGVDNVFNLDDGGDGIPGSADDSRMDDVNLHWFHQATNSPLALPPVTDATTYARDTANLPSGSSFAANADRQVLAALGAPDTEASMQQGAFSDEVQRELVGDDITTRQLAMSGLDLTEGTADDYDYSLVYQGVSADPSCNINVSFNNAQTGFAVCQTGGAFLSADDVVITTSNTFYNTGFSWAFTTVPNSPVARADLNPPSLSVGDRAGSSVDIEGNYAVIGSRLDDHGGFANAGSAFIYRRQPGDIWVEDTQLFGPLDSGSDQDKFGHSVAISGDFVAVGAENDDDQGFRAGKVHLFGRNQGGPGNWGLVTSIVGSDTVAKDFFGRSVSLDGDTLVVGAHTANAGGAKSGAVYVFDRNQGGADNWGQTQKLVASDGAAGDRFGIDVAVDGDNLVVGAHRKSVGGNANTGQAYFFERVMGSWAEDSIHTGEVSGDQFGISVGLDGSRAVVGSWLSDSVVGNQTGAAFAFENDSGAWVFDEKLARPAQQAGDRFGYAVAISGGRILIGAPEVDDLGSDAGLAYYFELRGTSWEDAGELSNPEVTIRDEFGSSVALDSIFGLIGSPLDNQPSNAVNNSGGAYLEIL